MNCKNCEHIVDGKYCSHCGQDAKVDQINFSNIIDEVTDSVFQINRGLFYTLKELFVRPGYSIRAYLNGKRKNHVKPISYLLTFSAIYFLVAIIFGGNTWMNDVIAGFSNGIGQSEGEVAILSILTWLSNHFAYATLLLLPVFSLASYLSFSRNGTNYLEHIVINSFITGQQAIFYSIFLILNAFIHKEFIELMPGLISIVYAFWVFWQFFSNGNRLAIVLRSILTYVLFLVFSFIIIILLYTILKL